MFPRAEAFSRCRDFVELGTGVQIRAMKRLFREGLPNAPTRTFAAFSAAP
jgi:hypothetical protein